MNNFLQGQFHTKDMGQLWCFLGIEVARLKEGISLSQQKYVLDNLEDSGLMGSKLVETPMDPNLRLCVDQCELLSSPYSYRRLVGKLNHLTITRIDIAFVASVVSHLCQLLTRLT